MNRHETAMVIQPEPRAVTEARGRMPSIQYRHNLRPGAHTVLFLPGASRDHLHYEGPVVVDRLAVDNNVIAVGYPYQEIRSPDVVDQKPEQRDWVEASQRVTDAIELLNTLQSKQGDIHLVVKSVGVVHVLAYLREHPEISQRTMLTVLGLPFYEKAPKRTAFDTRLKGLAIIQGKQDRFFTPDKATEYVQQYAQQLGCNPTVIGVGGDHSYRGESQEKEGWTSLPEHLPEVLGALGKLRI